MKIIKAIVDDNNFIFIGYILDYIVNFLSKITNLFCFENPVFVIFIDLFFRYTYTYKHIHI